MAAITRELLETLLEDMTFPARRREVLDHVSKHQPYDAVRQALSALPDRSYASAAQVGHALEPVQPAGAHEPPRAPPHPAVQPQGARARNASSRSRARPPT